MKTCIVTGAASGIGFATTRALLAAGWRVAGFDRDAPMLAKAAAELGGADVSWHRVDITAVGAVDAIVAQIATIDGDGGLLGLVNCAGIGIAKRFVDTTADDLRRMHEVNVIGTFNVAKAVVRAMQAAGRGGAIVNLASTAGQRGHFERSAYGSAKAGVIVLDDQRASFITGHVLNVDGGLLAAGLMA